MDSKKFKYSGACTEEQARKLVNCLSEDGIMIDYIWMSAKNFGLDIYKLVSSQNATFDYKKPTEDEFKGYVRGLEALVNLSEKAKVMPLTTIIIDSWGDTKIENFHLYGLGYPLNEDILKIYTQLTDISKLLKGWTAYFIRGERIDHKRGITKVKKLVENLPEQYSLDSLTILSHPWIRSADHYCDYLECDAEFSYRDGKIEIKSDTELFKVYKKLRDIGLQLEKVPEALPASTQ